MSSLSTGAAPSTPASLSAAAASSNDNDNEGSSASSDEAAKEQLVIAQFQERCALSASESMLGEIREMLEQNPYLAREQLHVSGMSPLMVAASVGNLELLMLLVEYGAPWNAIDRKGKCAGNHAYDIAHQGCIDYLVAIATRAELILGAAQRNETIAKIPVGSNLAEQPCTKESYISRKVKYFFLSLSTCLLFIIPVFLSFFLPLTYIRS
jgi:hypothetical protein